MLLSIITSILGCYLQFFSGWQLGLHLPGSMPIGDLSETFGKCLSGFVQLFDISKGVGVMIFSLFSVMITMTIADMFDTIGTVLATASGLILLMRMAISSMANGFYWQMRLLP